MMQRTRIRWSTICLLASALGLSAAGAARADDHHRHRARHRYYHDHDDDGDHARWWREHRESNRDGHLHGDNTRDCAAIRDRIRYDGAQVRSIAPTGRHEKAMQWYKDDIENARNDLRNCR